MKHGLPFFIREVISFEIPTRRYTSISSPIYDSPQNVLGIQNGKKGIKVFAFDVSQRYDSWKGLVVTDVKLGESGREVCRVSREEISMDAI
jgi:hypothetical protein